MKTNEKPATRLSIDRLIRPRRKGNPATSVIFDAIRRGREVARSREQSTQLGIGVACPANRQTIGGVAH